MKRTMIALGLLWLSTTPGYAQYPVTDGAALTQRLGIWAQEAIKWTDSLAQQKQIITDQLTMVSQGAKQLLATPMDIAGQINSLMTTYNGALADVRGISYTIDSAKQQWESLYGATTSGATLPAKAAAIAQAIQQASSQANQAEAIYTRLCADTTQIQNLLAASKAAPGSLAAMQVQTQINALLAGQMQTLTQIEMTEARAHIMQIADDARTTEQSVKNSQNWISGFTDPSLTPTPFGQGKGNPLPQ